jgi:hypothetical protein
VDPGGESARAALVKIRLNSALGSGAKDKREVSVLIFGGVGFTATG